MSKVYVPFQKNESPCTTTTILMILSFFLSLALIITLFYSFFKRCDRIKFAFKHKCRSEPIKDSGAEADIPFTADAPADETVD